MNELIFIYIIYYFLYFIEKIYSKNVINILITKPNINDDQYLDKQNQLINQYFVSKNINYDVNFSYCVPESTDGEGLFFAYQASKSLFSVDVDYARNFNCTLRELKNSNYDMMIVDDTFLFSDNSYITNTFLESLFLFQDLTDFYVNYSDYEVKDENISHHDSDILKDGKTIDNKLYGLPYELDFDILYYHNNATALKDLLSTKVNNFSELNNLGSDGVLSTGLLDSDELINLFAEFIRYQYDIPKEEDPLSYDTLYGKKSHEIFNSFREYVLKLTGNDINKTLSTSMIDAYNSFVNGEKKVLKGKASYYKNFMENQNISVSINSLPGGMSVISEKYLVINKNSKQPIDHLVQVALQLTSSEMQIYRAQNLGSIPTINFKNKSDGIVNSYCKNNSNICSIMNELKPLRITNIFRKSMYSANYLESRLVLPYSLRNNLSAGDDNLLQKTLSNILDIWNDVVETFKVSPLTIVMMSLNACSFVTVIYLFVVMFKVYRNQKHPYIKAMSPQLSNIAIFGIALKIIYPYTLNVIRTNFLCQMNVVINFFIDNLIYTPLFAIIFRIYYIYTNVSNMSLGKKLHDRRIIIYIILILILTFLGFFGISSFDEFNLVTTGSLNLTRTIVCNYDFAKYTLYSNIYTIIMFILMMGMTITVHKLSKKYGDTKFIFFIVLLLITSFVCQQAFSTFMSTTNIDDVPLSLLATIFVQLVTSVITVHLLIGNRLLYIRRNPLKNSQKFNSSDFKKINNIVKFIGMKRNMDSSFTFFDGSSNKSSNKSTYNKSITETYIKIDPNYDKKDGMMSSNNYRSFSHTLQSMTNSTNNYSYDNNSMYINNIIDNDTLKNYSKNNNYNNNNNNNNINNKKNSYYYYNKLNDNIDYSKNSKY